MSRIVQLSTFPTLRPRHGGQRRAHEMRAALQAAGHAVRPIAAYAHEMYPGVETEPALDIGGGRAPEHPTNWLFDGVRSLVDRPEVIAALRDLIGREPADLLLLEEPWLWPVLRDMPMIADGTLPVLYSAYNIDAPLFAAALERDAHPQAAACAAVLDAAERDLARQAIGCIAVTEADAAVLRGYGARRVAVAANGVAPRPRGHLLGCLPMAVPPDCRYVLYVASGHPPNAAGVPAYLEAMMAELRPLERIALAGGVTRLIGNWLRDGGPRYLARGRLLLFGEIPDFALDGLIANAAGMVLPVSDGGGSNLKTAEALHCGLPLVATPTAMRGFDAFADLPGIRIAGEPAGFAAAMRRVFDEPQPCRVGDPRLDALLWRHTLQPAADLVRELLQAEEPAVALPA